MARLAMVVAVTVVVALAAIPSALADNRERTRLAGYGGVAGAVQQKIGRKSPLAATATRESLPFTGLDLAVIFGGGLLLTGTGLALRRRTRRVSE